MSHAFANGLPSSVGNRAPDAGQSGLPQYGNPDFGLPRTGSAAGEGLNAMLGDQARRPGGMQLQPDFGVAGPNTQMWQQLSGLQQGFGGSDYDNFLASAGLGVKQQRLPQVPSGGQLSGAAWTSSRTSSSSCRTAPRPSSSSSSTTSSSRAARGSSCRASSTCSPA